MQREARGPAIENDPVEEYLATRISYGMREFKVRGKNSGSITWFTTFMLLCMEQHDVLEDWLDQNQNPNIRKRMCGSNSISEKAEGLDGIEGIKYYGYEEHVRMCFGERKWEAFEPDQNES